MGSLLTRSSSQEDIKVGKDKRKRRHQHDRSFESDTFHIHKGNKNENSYGDSIDTYEMWDTESDQQNIMNMNGKI